MSTVGAYSSAALQKAALRSQARLDEINAKMSDAAARAELVRSEREQQAIRLRGANVKGSQRAAIAAGGIDMASSPTVDAVLGTTDYFTEADAIQAEANGIRAAWGQRINAGNLRRSAAGKRATASAISPLLAGVTSAIGSAGQLASSWYSMDKVGAFDKGGGGGGSSGGMDLRGFSYGNDLQMPVTRDAPKWNGMLTPSGWWRG